jgi:alkanesulfonate monooxygenase SsuD/methylene tetrahydromethanopterin reductase-like flavin-dependent oxidoreductase (luciferase family)
MATDLQSLCGGRLILGIGAGGSDEDLGAYGVGPLSLGERLRRLEEALGLIRRLFTGETQHHRGAHYTGGRLALERSPVPPPILVGGHGPRLLRVAARHADAVNVRFDMSVDEWGRLKARLTAEHSSSGLAEEPLVLSHNMSIARTGGSGPGDGRRVGEGRGVMVLPFLLTVGAPQSNHCRCTAGAARRAGWPLTSSSAGSWSRRGKEALQPERSHSSGSRPRRAGAASGHVGVARAPAGRSERWRGKVGQGQLGRPRARAQPKLDLLVAALSTLSEPRQPSDSSLFLLPELVFLCCWVLAQRPALLHPHTPRPGWMVAGRELAALAERLLVDSVRTRGVDREQLTSTRSDAPRWLQAGGLPARRPARGEIAFATALPQRQPLLGVPVQTLTYVPGDRAGRPLLTEEDDRSSLNPSSTV